MPLHPYVRKYFTFSVNGELLQMSCLPMGWLASPAILTKVFGVVVRHLRSPASHTWLQIVYHTRFLQSGCKCRLEYDARVASPVVGVLVELHHLETHAAGHRPQGVVVDHFLVMLLSAALAARCAALSLWGGYVHVDGGAWVRVLAERAPERAQAEQRDVLHRIRHRDDVKGLAEVHVRDVSLDKSDVVLGRRVLRRSCYPTVHKLHADEPASDSRPSARLNQQPTSSATEVENARTCRDANQAQAKASEEGAMRYGGTARHCERQRST